jgi:2-polyprenyl-3-methyl-5-hydroxy-6-metoxy-1,4-benzoquinol methylase
MGENSRPINSTTRACPACNSSASFQRGCKKGFELLTCRRCKTLYTSHLPSVESAENYDNYYHEENLTVPAFINQRVDEIIADFAPYRQNGQLLDVGSGAGTLLEATRRAGWQSFGVDVAERAVEHARDMGFEVFCGTLQEARYPDNYFDVVTASELLEHLSDPQEVLHEIARVLRPGGLLWLTTPHGRGVSAQILGLKWSTISPPEHLQLFSRDGSKRMLAAAGLRQVRVVTEGVNPYELLHGLRARSDKRQATGESRQPGFQRVESSYRLNEALMASPSRRRLKDALNGLLNVGRLGDSLKIWAEK